MGADAAEKADEPVDVFISYSRQDKARAEVLVDALGRFGWRVWWDDHIPTAERWEAVLRARIGAAKAVLVCWSETAVKSAWVRKEAELAREQGKFVPISFDGSAPPDAFSALHATNLRNWYGGLRWPGLAQVFEELASKVGGEVTAAAVTRVVDLYKTQRRIAMAWYVTSLIAVLYAVSMWLASQTGGVAGAFFVIDSHPVKGSLIALVVTPFFLLIASNLLCAYAKRLRDEHWVARIPRLGFAKPEGDNAHNRLQGLLILFVFTLLPALSMIHFTLKAAEGATARCRSEPAAAIDFWRHVPEPGELTGHVYCFAGNVTDAAAFGVQVIPFYQPYAMALLALAAWFWTARALWLVFRAR